MDGLPYDAAHIASFYDSYGTQEWDRFDQSPHDRVSLEVHKRLLREHIRPGNRVLDAGTGPGRFTLELVALGASVVAGDVSPVQLEQHARRTAGAGAAVEDRRLLDIVDLSEFRDGEFDAVVCYGGPLSYVLGEADRALAELLRVVRVGGPVLLSVMSRLGAARAFRGYFPELVDAFGWERAVTDVLATGDVSAELNDGHVCRLYRWRDLEALLGRHPCRLVAVSAANFLTVGMESERWDDRWLDVDVEACREPGALDGGTHIVAAVVRT